jgi:uncharacterized membrane protein YraQ (UPF0718 family)
MHVLFPSRKDDSMTEGMQMPEDSTDRSLWQNALYFASLIGILVFANISSTDRDGLWQVAFAHKWWLTGASAALLGIILVAWFELKWWAVLSAALLPLALAMWLPDSTNIVFGVGLICFSILLACSNQESAGWLESSWDLAKQILPLLLWGVLAAGLLLGRPSGEGIIPSEWVAGALGGNSLPATLLASVAGAFMYFATLTEVPILEGLIAKGMGQGPALALLLAGPAISLPNMLVIRSIMGTRKTIVYTMLVIVMATVSGLIYGRIGIR